MNKQHFINGVYLIQCIDWQDNDEFVALVNALMSHHGVMWCDLYERKDELAQIIIEENAPAIGRMSAMDYAELTANILSYNDEFTRWNRYETAPEAFADLTNQNGHTVETIGQLCEALMVFSDDKK